MSLDALNSVDKLLSLVDNAPIVEYRLLRPNEVAQALKLLSDAFQHGAIPDPPNSLLSHRLFTDIYYHWLEQLCKKNTHLCAVHKYSGEVVGLCCGEDYADVDEISYDSVFLDVKKEKPSLEELMQLCYDLRKAFVDHERTHGHVWYIEMMAVDSRYRNLGIVTQLIKQSVELAKSLKSQKSFHVVFAESNSDISLKCFKKCGFECRREIKYKDWESPKGSGRFPLKRYGQIPLYDTFRLVFPIDNHFERSTKTKFVQFIKPVKKNA
ncbi:hypothetical protein RFI_37113 [Reticulomyxa filosa]|uniref:N-acetyltransferase domain-containing protein n=1 Tax=Reticulomyxa filosa TaxID=46433 RepID=X6LG40_RETFI|nr:hypothetical protein RFI_37113 [Reticulomyxa filosa]|eukprot:ETO00331.1 hypothetical protein RFI_37113 [Reticulomyxa filosa]